MDFKKIIIESAKDMMIRSKSESTMLCLLMDMIDIELFNEQILIFKGVDDENYESRYTKFIENLRESSISNEPNTKELFIEFCDSSEVLYSIIKDIFNEN